MGCTAEFFARRDARFFARKGCKKKLETRWLAATNGVRL
jgi:hypothetical protein